MFKSNSFAPSAKRAYIRPGFTLVDLLVAIGVIAMLTALAIPISFKARAADNNAQCLQNLNQLYKASKMWMTDHPRDRFFSGGEDFTRGLKPYFKDTSVFVCPADPNPFPTGVATLAILVHPTDEIFPLVEGPQMHRIAQGDWSDNLQIGDTPALLTLNVKKNANGSATIKVLSRSGAVRDFDLVVAETKGVVAAKFQTPGQTQTVSTLWCSYGWNADERAYGITGKVLALDYYRLSADSARDDWAKHGQWPKSAPAPEFARHVNAAKPGGVINVLWSDGSASTTTPDQIALPNNPATNSIAKWQGVKQ